MNSRRRTLTLVSDRDDLDRDLDDVERELGFPELPDREPAHLEEIRQATRALGRELLSKDWGKALVYPAAKRIVREVGRAGISELVVVVCTRTFTTNGRFLIVNARVNGRLVKDCALPWSREHEVRHEGTRKVVVLPHREGDVIEFFAHYAKDAGRVATRYLQVGELDAYEVDEYDYSERLNVIRTLGV